MSVVYMFTRSAWRPAVDIYRTDEGLLLVVEAHGCRPEDVRVTVERRQVVVAGTREAPVRAARWIRGEIAWGAFERTIALPEPVDPQRARAALRDGLLFVHCAAGVLTTRAVRVTVETLD